MREWPVWDTTTLHKMVGNDAAMHHRMLTLFLRDAEHQVPAIEVAASSGNLTLAAHLAHVLKTSTRMVGALQMGQLCEEIETAGDANEAPLCGTLASRLVNAFSSVKKTVQAQMQASTPP